MNILELYISYFKCVIFTNQVEIIQKYFRMRLFMKNIRLLIHSHNFNPVLHDIIELSYLPPTPLYQLFKNGGFNYQCHETSFYRHHQLLLS